MIMFTCPSLRDQRCEYNQQKRQQTDATQYPRRQQESWIDILWLLGLFLSFAVGAGAKSTAHCLYLHGQQVGV